MINTINNCNNMEKFKILINELKIDIFKKFHL